LRPKNKFIARLSGAQLLVKKRSLAMSALHSMTKIGALGAVLLGGAAFAPLAMAGNPGGMTALPGHAQPGQCYARVRHGAQYAEDSQIVVVEEGYQRLEVAQPQIQTRQEQVMTKEASVRYEVRQPQYRSVTEQVMTRPAYETLSVSQPEFKTVQETVQVSAPRVVWKRGNPGQLMAQGYNVLSTAGGGYGASSGQSGYQGGGHHASGGQSYGHAAPKQHCGANCEIWCLVEEPGETMTYNRKVLANPGQVSRKRVPPKYTTVSMQVVADPGGVREIPVPAEYSSITVEDIVQPGSVREVNVPPVQGRIKTRRLVENERFEWMRVICDTGQVMNSGQTYGQSQTYGQGQTYGHSSGQSHGTSYGHGQTTHGGASTGITYGGGAATGYGASTGITYGGGAVSDYQASQPSAMIYGSSNSAQPDYGLMDYEGTHAPRTYGGEGMNAGHSPYNNQ